MYKTDLHIHTCLSPCGELDMSPRNIVKQALKCGLDIIGICDHNSCENIPYVKKSAEKEGLSLIGGIEVTSKEEVHILTFFDSEEELFSMQSTIYENLPGCNRENFYGDQVVVNEKDEVLTFNQKFLLGSTELSVEEIVNKVHELNGIAIASHVDRQSFSIFGQLGFIPAGLDLDALEITNIENISHFNTENLPFITASDAHRLENIGKNYTYFFLKDGNLSEIKKSFQGEGNRKVIC